MDNPNWHTAPSMCMKNDPGSSFPVSEFKNIERFGFYVNLKIPKRQFVRGGTKKMQIPSSPRLIWGAMVPKHHHISNLPYADACEQKSTLNSDFRTSSGGFSD